MGNIMKSSIIRKKFLAFFEQRGHTYVASSSLIPTDDPTLLFTNAGMNQFKDVFLGKATRSYTRAVSIQKCVRAGGKHNDLDNVGFTKRHLTFFEMMGNFSFGDYFKKEAIMYAWDFLTKEIGLSLEKLHATVYQTDDESYDIWHNVIGLPKEKIHRLGAQDNFWQMGDVGPCGPCSEIHIDRGPVFGCKNEKSCGPACECERFIEIWNLVFMQYDRQKDGTDKPLKKKGVDTGMGLERLCVLLQKKDSVFEIDLFEPIIKKIEVLTGKKYPEQPDTVKAAFHVLADHIRSTSFLIADGCLPSNEGRGYVLRKIIRRALLFSQRITEKTIFPALSSIVEKEMGTIYPELKVQHKLIVKILEGEIKKFSTNLTRGQQLLNRYFDEHKKQTRVTGAYAFKLYDTYGFPLELIMIMAQERGFTVDIEGFEQEMKKQKEQSGKKMAEIFERINLDPAHKTEFTGYDELETPSTITALIYHDKITHTVDADNSCWIVTKKSPFYSGGGGQIHDKGWVTIKNTKTEVLALKKINSSIALNIQTPLPLKVGDRVLLTVDKNYRDAIARNHTAAHMLQAALIHILGTSVKQAGSYVDADYLRYDFTYTEPLTLQQIKEAEDLVNQKIRENIPLRMTWTTLDDARARGITAFFDEKYNPERVRIVEILNFSSELCGGTHVHATGEIGLFKITEVKAPSAGHRRIVALTGKNALELFQDDFTTIKHVCNELKVNRSEILATIQKQQQETKELRANIKEYKNQFWKIQIPQWTKQIEYVDAIPLLVLMLENATNEELKSLSKILLEQKEGFYFLISQLDNRSFFVATVSPQLSNRINLNEFCSWLQESQGLRGGIKKNTIQGGGGKFDMKLKEEIRCWIQKHQK